MTATQNEDQAGAREPWKNYLDEEIQDAENGSIDQAVPILIRDILEPDSASEAAIKKAALQLDEYDKSVLLSYDFMVRRSVSEEWSVTLTPLRPTRSWMLLDSSHMTTRDKTESSSYSKTCGTYLRWALQSTLHEMKGPKIC